MLLIVVFVIFKNIIKEIIEWIMNGNCLSF